ncbi:MAG: exported protein of unknown function [Candidatus Saccharibacteria bacterium]|nr:exported protein of unknown function [Candidatus Saccharibacteria bacterium]
MLRLQTSRRATARLILGVSVLIALLVSLAGLRSIASAESFDPNAAEGLQISPALVELNAEQGKTYTLKLKILNVTNSDLIYDSSINDFGAKDETGSPQVLFDSDLPASASVRGWITTLEQFRLRGQETRQLDVQVQIPVNAEPGGHYGVITFSGKTPELVDTGVGVTARTGLLVLIRVDGAIQEKLSLASFTAERNNKQHGFFESSPMTFVSRLKNEGNVHVKPVGKVEVRDMFGGLVASLPVNEPAANVLPGSIRRFESELHKDWMIGRYSANLTLGYGTTGQAITGQISFWVIPYKLLLAGSAILVTLFYILRRLIRVYNRHIIKKAKQTNANKTKKRKNK